MLDDVRASGADGFIAKEDLPEAPLQQRARGRLAMNGHGEYGAVMATPRRVVIGEDDVLLREGIVHSERGRIRAAAVAATRDLLRKSLAHRPDVIVVDVQMLKWRRRPTRRPVRRRRPEIGVLILSVFYEEDDAPS
jgi:hypothetical protein